jgi:deoxyribose-phosphate aldolase
MRRAQLAPLLDHTVLGPTTTPAAVDRAVTEAAAHGMNVCVPPCYVADVAGRADAADCTVATVIGFPHGQDDPEIKREAGSVAWKAGADELDVVCNVGRLRAGETDAVAEELAAIVASVPIPVKVILETALLDAEGIERGCRAAVAADAAMVKTSTGFADADPAGATVADVERMAAHLPVKASGGIGDYETAITMLEAGAERIGTSSGVAILEGAPE